MLFDSLVDFLSVLASLVFIAWLSVLLVPTYLRKLLVANCKDRYGRFRLKKAFRQFRYFFDFISGIAAFAMVVMVAIVALLLLVHETLIPLSIMESVASVFSFDGADLKENLQFGGEGNIAVEHTDWFMRRGGSQEGARALQSMLFRGFPAIAALAFFTSVILMKFFTRWYDYGIDRLFEQVHRHRNSLGFTDSSHVRP